jgi:hypothetical protein
MKKDKELFICDHCGQAYGEGETEVFRTDYEGDVCQECYENEFSTCDYTGRIVLSDTLIKAYRRGRDYRTVTLYVCEQAIEEDFRITTREQYWHENDVYMLHNGEYVSPDDVENGHYSTCDCCGELFHSDDVSFNEYSDSYECYLCENANSETRLIHPYNYKPDAIFHGDNRIDTIGTEVEVDSSDYISSYNRDGAAKYVLSNLGTLAYNKEDGSLRHGFEIVTHPATYEYLYSKKDVFKNVFDELANKGLRSHDTDTCGLHIHVGRRGFNSEQAICNFVYLFEKFYDQVLKFSRRTPYSMQRWADRYGIYSSEDTNKSFANKLDYAGREKYRIVNLRHNSTLEVRAFKGTINVDTYFASIQFMLVMKELANTVDNVVNGVSWLSVVRLAKVRGYEELQNYLVKRDLHDVKSPEFEKTTLPALTLDNTTELVVVDNSSRLYHYLPHTPCTVRYVGQQDERDRIIVTPVHPDDRRRLIESIGRDTQFVLLSCVSILDPNTNLHTRLTEYTLTCN